MPADRHRRDAYASAGARTSQRQMPARRRTATRDLAGGTGPVTRGHRRSRRRSSKAPTLVLVVVLVLGFVAIAWLLVDRDRPQHDPFTTIAQQLQAEAPATFEAHELDGIGRRVVTEALTAGHPRWFTSAREQGGHDQRAVMQAYWDTAAAALAADQQVQAAYRRAGMSFVFRGQWFGDAVEPAWPTISPLPPPAEAEPTPPPAAPTPEPEPEPAAPEPETEPEPEGREAAPQTGPDGINRLM